MYATARQHRCFRVTSLKANHEHEEGWDYGRRLRRNLPISQRLQESALLGGGASAKCHLAGPRVDRGRVSRQERPPFGDINQVGSVKRDVGVMSTPSLAHQSREGSKRSNLTRKASEHLSCLPVSSVGSMLPSRVGETPRLLT